MKKSNPKLIFNFTIENPEFEEKVKIAMDEYAEKLIIENLDNAIIKIVDRRIERLINGSRWSPESKINGVTFEEFVKNRTEKALADAIDKNAKEILAKKLASLL